MTRIAVAGPSGVVTEAAVAVADQGGSVVDVAIVAALTAMCTEPGMCGPGGGGFLSIRIPGVDPVVIDGYMAHPGEGFTGEPLLRPVTMSYGGGVTTLVGAGSVAVPGVFAALEMASSMFGRAPWATLMGAVADAVEHGFPMSPACHRYLSAGAAPIYEDDPVAREALFVEGDAKPIGARVVFPGLAETLRHIGDEGAEVFYLGDLGEAIVDHLAARGGQLTRDDLASYEALPRAPLESSRGEWRLFLNPAPAVGGVAVARTVELSDDGSPAALTRALTTAFSERRGAGMRSPSTISVAAADCDGGVVAASMSAGYGSGVIPSGTGMLMNNALGETELVAGPGTPGERLVSNMAPTVALSGDGAVALGSPGADRITTAVATTLVRLAKGDDLARAIDHPRIHPETDGTRRAAEPGLDLTGVEMPVHEYEALHMYFGGVNGAGVVDGHLRAHADSRRTGAVAFAG